MTVGVLPHNEAGGGLARCAEGVEQALAHGLLGRQRGLAVGLRDRAEHRRDGHLARNHLTRRRLVTVLRERTEDLTHD